MTVAAMLFGRDTEASFIGALLDGARAGRSGALVIRGEAGIGKTALLDLAEQAAGATTTAGTIRPAGTTRPAGSATVLRATAIETEAELPFAGLHLLLRPVVSQLASIPGRQADAIERAFGLADAPVRPADDVFLVGLAVLSLLTEVAEERPVLCLIDDAQWLDGASATALLFAARRLDAEGVVIMLAVRDGSRPLATAGLAQLQLEPLSDAAARQLLADEAAGLDPLLAVLAAATGDEPGCRSWLAAYEQGDISGGAWGYCVALPATMELAHGRLGAAFAQFRAGLADEKWRTDTAFWYQPDIVEAAARGGDLAWARDVATVFGSWASSTGQAWALAVTARCRALSDPSGCAERHFEEALRCHADGGRPLETARTRLVYGEWLRREKRRTEAAAQLARAIEAFDALGASAWAQRAGSELAATGQAAARAQAPGVLARLTPQEYQIVKLAAQGRTNREIAAQLFLSHRTVGYHLYKAYPKLGISSRTQLADMISAQTPPPRGSRSLSGSHSAAG